MKQYKSIDWKVILKYAINANIYGIFFWEKYI